jgi:hypothetical protein
MSMSFRDDSDILKNDYVNNIGKSKDILKNGTIVICNRQNNFDGKMIGKIVGISFNEDKYDIYYIVEIIYSEGEVFKDLKYQCISLSETMFNVF